MRTRALDRVAAGISVALLTALGLFTFYLSQVAESENQRTVSTAPASNRPDYFVDRMAVLSMTPEGAPSYRLEARRLEHFASSDIAAFEAPIMVSLDPQRPRVTVTALRGELLDRGDEVRLSGEVHLTREGSAERAPMTVRTEYAIVYPNTDRVVTDRPVEVIQGDRQLNGTGMLLDHRSRQLQVDSAVRVVITAPPPPVSGGPAGTPDRPPTSAP